MNLLAQFRTSASQLPFSSRETVAYTREHFDRAENVVKLPIEAVVGKLLIEPLNIANSLVEHFITAVKQTPEIARVIIKGETSTPKEFLTTSEEITAYLDKLDAKDLAREI